jgi:hypothetical protein
MEKYNIVMYVYGFGRKFLEGVWAKQGASYHYHYLYILYNLYEIWMLDLDVHFCVFDSHVNQLTFSVI